ncbi:MAG: sensor histidine kinase [Cellulosilyticaceae bacterium]
MRKFLKALRFIPLLIWGLISLISQIILKCILALLMPLSKVLRTLFDKLHVSITLKLNLFYGMLYGLFFIGAYALTLSLCSSYLDVTIENSENLIFSLKLILGVAMSISFILFLLIGQLGVKKILLPIQKLDAAIKQTDAHQLQARLDISGTNDELKDLAKTFNSMMDRLEVFINKQKQFVSDASHELRTPIAVIQGYANLLERWGKDDPKILEESILAITQETDNMKQLVEKLLFLARSDKSTQVVEKSELNLSVLATQVVRETSFIDDEHEFVSTIEDDVLILADPNLLKELLRILVDNATKYTPENGHIEIIVRQTTHNVILGVKDTGIGIDHAHLPFLFERFYRVDEARTSETGGSGLGLAIAKWIVDIHDGKIYVDSKIGIGTEFIVFFNLF